ncbi:hypothetical protein LO772_01750 [Yinghuangia sp. ASG 101]|uniref:hypothetical protein n=1 Tax=Yinghuangia sp. ASG 101 TaxID=2896848 RepID=UPI001E5A0586|nr:hypothetical protein [Yinghuangia sp. ASG 101]UGQ12362.1 hypothetical protein LO772_01750 [Yinghuangia sp. ASG 101]
MTTTFVRVTVRSDADAAKAREALARLRGDRPTEFEDESGTRTLEAVIDDDRRLDAEAVLKTTGLHYEVMADDE